MCGRVIQSSGPPRYDIVAMQDGTPFGIAGLRATS
jgi:hypothetical protein